jgi:hypothetical protein
MPFDLLNKCADSDDATKAIFEHFRNVLTAGAVGAAGAWMAHRGSINSAQGLITHVEGFLLVILSFGLLYLAMTNAQVRMAKAGYGGWRIRLVSIFYGALVVGGLTTYAVTR